MKRLAGPIGVQIELTEGCTQCCTHCYNYWRYGDIRTEGELNTIQFLEILEALNEVGISHINMTGGEPFLRPDIIFFLLQQAKQYGMFVGLNSNAVIINQTYAQQLRNEGLDIILISLLGTEITHNFITGARDGFRRTCRGINYLVEAGLNVSVNMVVSNQNQDEVYEVGRIASQLGTNTFSATPMIPSHPSNVQLMLSGTDCKKALRALLRVGNDFNVKIDVLEPIPRCLFTEAEDAEFKILFGRRLCSAGITNCVISSRGKVRPCPHADLEFGDLTQEPFSAIWDRMSTWTCADIIPEECQSCDGSVICEAGCRMSAKLACGDYRGKDPYMSGAIHDLARISALPEEPMPALDLVSVYRVNPLCRFRLESFGAIAYIDDFIEPLSERGAHDFEQLRQMGQFTIPEAASRLECPLDELKRDLARMFKKGIIQLASK